MNLEIGEYVRTEIGTIGKVVRINEIYFTIENNRGEIDVLYEGNQKHSRNIIDLIEVGDYVNGHKINKKYVNSDNILCFEIEGEETIVEVKSIVTKQQFSNMEYKINE